MPTFCVSPVDQAIFDEDAKIDGVMSLRELCLRTTFEVIASNYLLCQAARQYLLRRKPLRPARPSNLSSKASTNGTTTARKVITWLESRRGSTRHTLRSPLLAKVLSPTMRITTRPRDTNRFRSLPTEVLLCRIVMISVSSEPAAR